MLAITMRSYSDLLPWLALKDAKKSLAEALMSQ